MPLSEEEKVKIRHHMGYLDVQEAYTFALGAPAGLPHQFLIEGSMKRVREVALPMLRQIVCILDRIECQMVENMGNLANVSIGTIAFNPKEQEMLTRRYDYFVATLGNLLGCHRNPFDMRRGSTGTFGNARVV